VRRYQLTVVGTTVGGVLGYERGEKWRGSVTFGGGAFLGSWRSTRDAAFLAVRPDPQPNIAYTAHIVDVSSVTAGYVSLNARLTRAIAPEILVHAGLHGMLFVGLDSATSAGTKGFPAGECPNPPNPTKCLGAGSLKAEQPFGNSFFAGGPEIGISTRFYALFEAVGTQEGSGFSTRFVDAHTRA